MKPDPKLVYEAQQIMTAANVRSVQKCLKWYEHWCAAGNEEAAQISAENLRIEISKAWKDIRSQQIKDDDSIAC